MLQNKIHVNETDERLTLTVEKTGTGHAVSEALLDQVDELCGSNEPTYESSDRWRADDE